MKQYQHYEHLPTHLKDNLNILREEYLGENMNDELTDELTLDLLISWIEDTFEESYIEHFDMDFLSAANRQWIETYQEKKWDEFMIDVDDLYLVVLFIKDSYELLTRK